METITLTPQMLEIVAVIAFIIQQTKGLPYVNKINPYLPLLSMALGVGLSYVWGIDNYVMAGIMEGMAASTGYKIFNPTKPEVTK